MNYSQVRTAKDSPAIQLFDRFVGHPWPAWFKKDLWACGFQWNQTKGSRPHPEMDCFHENSIFFFKVRSQRVIAFMEFLYIYIYGFFVVGWFCWLPYIAIKSTIFFPPQFPTGSYIRIPGLRRLRKESIVLCQQYLDHWCVSSYIALCCKMQFLFFLHDAIAWVCTTKLL